MEVDDALGQESAMPEVSVTLPPALTATHRHVVLKYFTQTERLRSQDWKLAFEAFDRLAGGTVNLGRKRQSFRQIYERFIEDRQADAFLTGLVALEDLEAAADALQQETAFAVLATLEREGLYREELADSEYLAAYCLYWWTAFARGYRFELSVFRDLRASGIKFAAHDIRKRKERRAPYDLVVGRQLGDIKNTTYFLHTARTRSLSCDFYITRLYHPRRRRYVEVVFLTEAAWRGWDGETTPVTLETAANLPPGPVRVLLEGQHFVFVPYDLWKQKVRQRQQEED